MCSSFASRMSLISRISDSSLSGSFSAAASAHSCCHLSRFACIRYELQLGTCLILHIKGAMPAKKYRGTQIKMAYSAYRILESEDFVPVLDHKKIRPQLDGTRMIQMAVFHSQ